MGGPGRTGRGEIMVVMYCIREESISIKKIEKENTDLLGVR